MPDRSLPLPWPPASWAARLGSGILDLLIGLGVPWLACSFVLFGTLTVIGEGFDDLGGEVMLNLVLFGVPPAACFAYLVAGWAKGQTIGMHAAAIRLVRVDGTAPGWWRAAIRVAMSLIGAAWLALSVMLVIASVAVAFGEPFAIVMLVPSLAAVAVPLLLYRGGVRSAGPVPLHDRWLGLSAVRSSRLPRRAVSAIAAE